MITREIEILSKLRLYLIESISQAADEIAKIDRQIAVLHSQELEVDPIQAAEANS